MEAFITGSRAYGTPGEDSDIDLVIRCDEKTRDKLVELLAPDDGYDDKDRIQVRSGKLNLMLCVDDDSFATWRDGTDMLQAEADAGHEVTRDDAIEVFRALRVLSSFKKSARKAGEVR